MTKMGEEVAYKLWEKLIMKIWKIRNKKTKLFFGKGRWKWQDGNYENLNEHFWHQRFWKEGGNIYQRFQDVTQGLKKARKEHPNFGHLLEIVEYFCREKK